jgi:protein SCO1
MRPSLPFTAVLAAALLLAGAAPASAQFALKDYEVGKYPIGGDFTLTNEDGGQTSLRQFRGKAVLMSFGYTHCPDVCPTTLALYKQVRAALAKPLQARLQVLFISVDPKRDTPAHLKQYIGYFDPHFLGLTGKEADLERIIHSYMGQFRIHESGGAEGYSVDHTAFIYLLDPQGKVRYLFSPDVPRDILVAGVKAVLGVKS